MVFLGNQAHSEKLEHDLAQKLLIDLSQASEPAQWFIVNDGVMGGRSVGSFQTYQNSAKFH